MKEYRVMVNSRTVLFTLLLLVSMFAATAFSAELRIVEMDVAGNVTLTPADIFSQVQLRTGNIVNKDIIAKDIENIAKLNGVDYAYYRLDEVEGGVKLTYVVVEREVIRDIIIKGNKKYRTKKLIKKTGLKKGDYLDRVQVGAAAETLKQFYEKKGFPFVTVKVNEAKLNSAIVEFDMDEGSKRIKTNKVSVTGNKALSDKLLLSKLKSKKKSFFFWKKAFDKKYPEADVTTITERYRNHGYLDADVTSRVTFDLKKGLADITFDVTEGPLYTVSSISITGNTIFDELEILSVMKLRAGEPYGVDKESHDAKAIRDKYTKLGYIDADIQLLRDFGDNHTIACHVDIVENSRYRIGRVNVVGNNEVQDKAVRDILDDYGFRPGEWYDGTMAAGDGSGTLETDLKRAVYAESAVITPVDGDPGTKNAIVDITEAQTGSIMFGAGISSTDGLIGQIVLEQRNFDISDWPDSMSEFITGKAFKGAGQTFRLSFEPGTEQTVYSLSWTDPYINDMPYSLTIGSSSFERDRESWTERRFKGNFALSRRYEDGWVFGLGGRAEDVDIRDIDPDAPKEIWSEEGSNSLYGFSLFLTRDRTNSRYTPTNGTLFKSNFEVVAGDYSFSNVSFTYRIYHPLWEDIAGRKTVLASKLFYGTIIGDAPTFEKYYAGGTGSIRGFDYRGISPRGESASRPGVYEDPIGSDWLFLANTEMIIPLSSDMFSWLVFFDSGTIETGTYRTSIGTGLEIMIPQWFGPVPMRFELAAPLTKDDDDDTQAFSFSVGRLF